MTRSRAERRRRTEAADIESAAAAGGHFAAMHDCPIIECETRIASDLVLCRKHWALVPDEIKRDVWRAWRRRERDFADEDAAAVHERAKKAAIDAVHDHLGIEA